MKSTNTWYETELGTIGNFSKGSGIGKNEILTEGIKAIRYGEIYTKHHYIVKEISSYISEDSTKNAKLITYGDILFAGSGETIDEIGKSAAYLLDDVCYVGGDTIILSPDQKKFDSLFLSYLLNSQSTRKQLRKLGQGQSIVHIYKSSLEKLQIQIPPLPEQKRIVKVIETWDKTINVLEKKRGIKLKVKKTLINNLLSSKVRFGEFDLGWKTFQISELCNIKRGGSPRPIEQYITKDNEGLNWLRIGDIPKGGRYITKTAEKIKPEGLNKTTVVNAGDFILSNSMSFGRPYIMKIQACIHDGWLALMNIDSSINKMYLYYLLTSQHIQSTFKSISAGSGVQNLKKESVEQLKITIPEKDEQDMIASFLTVLDDELDMIVSKLTKLKEQRKYLLNKLVFGELRTPENL
ncbi:MAG: restriction endonuclease subunit S [Patescibacteria group bacterium]